MTYDKKYATKTQSINTFCGHCSLLMMRTLRESPRELLMVLSLHHPV